MLGDEMGSRVVSEFHHGKKIRTFFGFVGGEQPQISFQLLIYSFGFPICLGVIGSGEGDIILKEASEFSGEGQGELWSSIRDNLRVEAQLGENMREKEFGDSGCIDVFCAGAINYPLHKAMVYHDHN